MPPSTPSRAWKYFTRSADNKSVTCNLCKLELVYKGTTSNLLNHVDKQHPSVRVKDDRKQASMASFVKTPTNKIGNENITKAIADMIILDYLPLSMVEGEGFRKLMTLVAPDYEIPCRNTIRSRVEHKFDAEKTKLCNDLENVSSASITTDTWTSNSTENFITVTEHHISDEWDMKSNVLMTRAMPERHTGENLASRLKDCVQEFNFDGKIQSCMHDNARNIQCAGKLCEQWTDLGCFAHTLQLCLKPALDLSKVSQVVNRSRKLVGHFKHSTTLTAELKNRQKTMGVPQRALIQDVPTRWNSTFAMLNRLVEQRRVITDILLDPAYSKKDDSCLNLNDREWDLVKELCDLLCVFEDVTSYMCTEKHISVSEILPIVCGLIDKRLIVSESESSTISKAKELIKEELQRRYNPNSDDTAESTLALATLLDPRYKKLPFFTSKQRRVTTDLLESQLDDLPLKRPDPHTDNELPTKRRKLDFLTYSAPDRSCQDELQTYLAEKMIVNSDPLD